MAKLTRMLEIWNGIGIDEVFNPEISPRVSRSPSINNGSRIDELPPEVDEPRVVGYRMGLGAVGKLAAEGYDVQNR